MIGQNIKRFREGLGISQEELAHRTGVHSNTIARWERDEVSPRGTSLAKLAKGLQVTPAELLSGETDNPGRASAAATPAELPESNVRPLSDVIWVPVVTSNIKVCCGDGAENDYEGLIWEEVGKYPILEADLIGYSWQLRDGGYHILTVEGDSMEPKVNDGDRILIADVEIRNGDLAVCLYRDRTILRGVAFEKDGVRLIPWNKDYSEIFVPQKDSEDLRFVGKMIGKIQLQIQPLSSML